MVYCHCRYHSASFYLSVYIAMHCVSERGACVWNDRTMMRRAIRVCMPWDLYVCVQETVSVCDSHSVALKRSNGCVHCAARTALVLLHMHETYIPIVGWLDIVLFSRTVIHSFRYLPFLFILCSLFRTICNMGTRYVHHHHQYYHHRRSMPVWNGMYCLWPCN